ncbi:MAG TPA: TonB family protein [Bacteroidota bacterium]|jgi:protein TonB|nr:TonB family protein [Bacteroidota bacterium]
MEPQEKLTPQQFIIDRLHDVQRKVENGNIQDALAELKEVKAADSKNIYIIALEKQILKLTDTETAAELRSEIIKALPPMIERAINDAQRRLAEKAQEPKEAKEKEAALEKLKSQYFQRADEYVEKGDYPHALEEIRRIYIIDAGNVVAKEYEQKIEQLASLKAKGEEPQEKETTSQPSSSQPKQAEEQPLAETKGKSKLPIILAAAVVILGVGIWLFTSSGSKKTQQPTQEQSVTSIEQPGSISENVKEETQQPESTTPTAKDQKNKQPEQKPVETKSSQQQSVSTTKEEQRQVPEPKVEQPKQATPPPQPAEQPAPTPQQAQAPQQQSASQTPEEAAPKPFVAIEAPPQIVKRAAPKYPEIAYRMRIEGKVVVEVTVDPQGKPIQAKIAKSSSDVFNEAAIEAAMKSTYKPAMMSTGPVTAKVYVPFDFKLR